MKIYLAIPYSGNELESFKIANQQAGKLMKAGNIVFSPISHTHPIAMECHLPGDYLYWEKFDEAFIRFCDEIHVVKLDGWRESTGVNAEITLGKLLGKPIRYIEYERGRIK